MGRNHRPRRARRAGPWWIDLSPEELSEVRLCDLDLTIEGGPLAERVASLEEELERAGLRFRPYVWLSTDWFTPDGLPGFAVPFYLAHRRLASLEGRAMHYVEGGSRVECLRLLRHETGHAIDNAYRLHRRKRWREVFGPFSTPYRTVYRPRPRSRSFVLNLDGWYAQSHPCEDFAETFAVWLRPGERWRAEYVGTPALEKLRYVDELMEEIADRQPPVRRRERFEPLAKQRETLREHYRRKRGRYEEGPSSDLDRALSGVFAPADAAPRGERAAAFLRRRSAELRRLVTQAEAGVYGIDQALKDMILRSRALGLRRARPERASLADAASCLEGHVRKLLAGRGLPYRR